jgi:hypothetical protein
LLTPSMNQDDEFQLPKPDSLEGLAEALEVEVVE